MTDSGPRESSVKQWSAHGPFTTMVTTTSHPPIPSAAAAAAG
jgi:hypothetical protein